MKARTSNFGKRIGGFLAVAAVLSMFSPAAAQGLKRYSKPSPAAQEITAALDKIGLN